METGEILSETIPPPVMGWNTKDPVSQMDPLYAIELVNYFPNGNTVDLRKGYRQHAKSMGTVPVHGLAQYNNASGNAYLLGLSRTAGAVSAYDATSSGAATLLGGGYTLQGSTISSVNFANKLFLCEFEGTDVYSWDGTANLAAPGFVGPGGDDKLLSIVTSYKSRLYFASLPTYGACSIWYGGITAVTGALTEFGTKDQFRKGGYINYLGSSSIGGNAPQEVLVIISNLGEVLVYQGDYPAAANWQILGRYYVPGYVSAFEWGNDVAMITLYGVVKLSNVMAVSDPSQYAYVTDSISKEFRSLMATARAISPTSLQPQIQGIVYPAGNYLCINIALSTTESVQCVMNLQTGAWTKFTNQNAFTWILFGDNLYFGGSDGKIFKADNGYFDEDPDNEGDPLTRTAILRPAYNYLGNRRSVKSFKFAQPIIEETEGLSINVDADIDYADTSPANPVQDLSVTGQQYYRPMCTLTGEGKAISVRFEDTVTEKYRSIHAIDVFWTEGGSLG